MNEEIIQLLTKLSAIGEEHYNEQYRTGKLNYQAVGLAIAEVTDNWLDFLHVAYSALEDLNYHNACAVLEFMAPGLYPPDPDAPAVEWLSNLERVQKMLNARGPLKVFTRWNDEKGEREVETYRLVVTLKKVGK